MHKAFRSIKNVFIDTISMYIVFLITGITYYSQKLTINQTAENVATGKKINTYE